MKKKIFQEIKRVLDDADDIDQIEVSPPSREKQVKGIKKSISSKNTPKTYVDDSGKRKKTNPFAIAWAQHKKYGTPKKEGSISESDDYDKFFKQALKKFKIKGSEIDNLSPKQKKKFFNYIDRNWKSDEESKSETSSEMPSVVQQKGIAKSKDNQYNAIVDKKKIKVYAKSHDDARRIIKKVGQDVKHISIEKEVK